MATRYITNQERIRHELFSAGVTKAALFKPQMRKLYQTIHRDERIEAAVYSSIGSGTAILLATNQRVIYIERRAFSYYVFDEFTYDIVSGVALRQQGPLYTLTLHTPINNFIVRTTNRRAAYGLVTSMERHHIEHVSPPPLAVPRMT